MANDHGGKRPGAGRPKKVVQYAERIESSDDKIANRFDDLTEVLLERAIDGITLSRKVYKPAAIVMVDDTEIMDSEHGPRSVKVKRQAFPDLVKKDPMTPVMVSHTVIETAPDVKVAQYLINRIAGSPVQQVEVETKQEVQLPQSLEEAMIAGYGPEETDDDDGFDLLDDDELDEEEAQPSDPE